MIASAFRYVGFCLFAACTILSDCTSLLGDWAYSLKYVGIVVVCALCVFSAASGGVERRRLALCLIGLALLIGIIPFQGGDFSVSQSIGLYLAVFVLACFSGNVLTSTRQLLIICIVAMLLVVVLLVLSSDQITSQWESYSRLNRPRFKGCFSNPNSLGNIAAILFIGISSARRGNALSRGLRRASLAFLVLALLIVLGSGSRTALVAVCGFVVSYWLIRWFFTSNDIRLRILFVFLYICVMASLVFAIANMVSDDTSLRLRVESLLAIDPGSSEALVGLGYVSSSGVSQITAAAGGATDMLYVSLFYRVGILGCIAYALFVIGATNVGKTIPLSARCLSAAILVALLLQSAGESYLSSVMSFVSCFDWIALGAVPLLVASEAPTCE